MEEEEVKINVHASKVKQVIFLFSKKMEMMSSEKYKNFDNVKRRGFLFFSVRMSKYVDVVDSKRTVYECNLK